MKIDTSRLLFEKYYSLKNKILKMKLKNGESYKCVITGYYYGSYHHINKWSICEIEDKVNYISDESFFFDDFDISHPDIKEVYFYEDNSSILL